MADGRWQMADGERGARTWNTHICDTRKEWMYREACNVDEIEELL